MEKLLEIRSLSVDFRTPRGRVRALREVSMVVPKGKIIGVVGESGSGKSTLIWTIMRLLAVNGTVENGEILFDGGNVLEFDDNRLKGFRGEKVSMVFQDPMTSQSPVLDYRSQFTDILYRRTEMSRRERLGKAIKMMNRVGIPDSEKRIYQYPHHFSGGMRQRAGIAMALLMDPSLLIADEPTTALDVTMEAQIIHLIREARSEFGSTVMLVSHNLGLIAELCDEIVVMYAGEIVEHADAHDIFFDAKHPYTKALIACNPALDLEMEGQFPTIPGDVPDLHQSPAGCVFAPRCAFSDETCSKERPAYSISAGKHSEVVDHSVRCHLYCPDKGGKTKHDLTALSLNAAADRTRSEIAHCDEADELLSIQDLRVRFPTMGRIKALAEGVDDPFIDAVYEVSLGLRAGETLGLVGESGSGKTTLGRAIIGLNGVHSGSIKFKGSELVGLSQNQYRKVRRDVAMMFQDPVGSLSPRRTVGQLLTEPFLIHGIEKGSQRDQAARLCEMVSLPANFLSRYPHELSGGQARRVGVATMAKLAAIPAVLVLMVLTVRASAMASYSHGDVPVEMLVYTQTSPDIRTLAGEFRSANGYEGEDNGISIDVDDTSGFTWPWAWYLRDSSRYHASYRNIDGEAIVDRSPTAEVLLVHSNNEEGVATSLQGLYTEGQRIRHRWWFPEHTYRDLTLDRLASGLVDRETWRSVVDYWLFREGVRHNIGSEDAYVYFDPDFPQNFKPVASTE